MLPKRIAKPPKRENRWKSPAHLAWIRGFHCCNCGSATNIEAAHVRMGSGAGMGFKPHDWRAVPLCGGSSGCHQRQHTVGEKTFWEGRDVEALINEFCKASPKAAEIRSIRNADGDT